MESYKTLIMIQEFASENLLHFFFYVGRLMYDISLQVSKDELTPYRSTHIFSP